MTESTHRRLVKVGDLVDGVLSRVAPAGVAPVIRLRLAWPDIAGTWSERCSVTGLRNGVLSLQVAAGIDATLLRFEAPHLIRRIDEQTGGEVVVERVDIRVAAARDGPG